MLMMEDDVDNHKEIDDRVAQDDNVSKCLFNILLLPILQLTVKILAYILNRKYYACNYYTARIRIMRRKTMMLTMMVSNSCYYHIDDSESNGDDVMMILAADNEVDDDSSYYGLKIVMYSHRSQ